MEMSPQRVRSAEFKTVRKGADPDEVKVFLNDVADELERAQNQSTAMEARARAAVARLQEVSESAAARGTRPVDASRRRGRDDQPHAAARAAHRRHRGRRGAWRGRPHRRCSERRGGHHARLDPRDGSAVARRSPRRGSPRRRGRAHRHRRRGRGAQGAARLPRVRRRTARAVPRRAAQSPARCGDIDRRHRRTGAGWPRRSTPAAAVGVRRRTGRRRPEALDLRDVDGVEPARHRRRRRAPTADRRPTTTS